MARSTLCSPFSEKKYIFLQGGLGNQLFQISLNIFLKRIGINSRINPLLLATYARRVTKRSFETRSILDSSDISYLDASLHFFLSRVVNNKIIFREKFAFNFDKKKLQEISEKKLIFGYFQSLRLVEAIYEKIRPQFQRKLEFTNPSSNLAIHVRAGDYLNDINKRVHGVLSLNYYESAIEKAFEENKKLSGIVIVSDDDQYSKKLHCKSKFFTKMEFFKTANSWDDLNLLLRNQHLIIANSSFSWWAGYLATKEFNSGVIMPKNWTKKILSTETDLVHASWQIV